MRIGYAGLPVRAFWAENIRRLREDRGWKKGELAQKAGVRPNTITRLEAAQTSDKPPKLTTLDRVARSFGVTAEALLRSPVEVSPHAGGSSPVIPNQQTAVSLPPLEEWIRAMLIDRINPDLLFTIGTLSGPAQAELLKVAQRMRAEETLGVTADELAKWRAQLADLQRRGVLPDERRNPTGTVPAPEPLPQRVRDAVETLAELSVMVPPEKIPKA